MDEEGRDLNQLARLEREVAWLREENARLKSFLEQHGIDSQAGAGMDAGREEPAIPLNIGGSTHVNLPAAEKVALFRRLFRGRTDVYPARWESQSGKSGYSPACANEWRPGICEKPRIKCTACSHRQLIPVTDPVIYDHLVGKHIIGVYPLLADDTCYFLAVDFDEADWRGDAKAFLLACRELEVAAALEISRSGQGAHVWIFFTQAVPARDARRLGSAIITYTCARTRQLKLSSYDRLFPNQDTLPKGGFGNLIALPLQKKARERGRSVFVDEDLVPYPDQWAFLSSMERVAPERIEWVVQKATPGGHPLDVAFITDEDQQAPWKRPSASNRRVPGPLPQCVTAVLVNQLFFAKADLPPPLANRLIRLAAFQNPEFYRAQAMRLPVWNKPRVIGCAENYPQHIALPRGCLDAVVELLEENGIGLEIHDERLNGEPIEVSFAGQLRPDQETAASAMLAHDIGVLCAPTAFGKTITAAAIIAQRGVNTLVLVHRTELLGQWLERLRAFLDIGTEMIGVIGGGQRQPTGKIDIAIMQSLSRKGEIDDRIEGYGQVIVDECHHLSAFSFEAILKRARARYVLGLTATPVRRDGQHPIIFMQCGPVRHTALRPPTTPSRLSVWPRQLDTRLNLTTEAGIQERFRQLTADPARNARLVADTLAAYREGRKVLLLTERTEHLDHLCQALAPDINNLFLLHGRMSKKRRAQVLAALESLQDEAPRVLLATGRLVGEGFDHPPLDTLILAMPIAWKGTLQQYAGRLHRAHALKSEVRILDYIDGNEPVFMRMWEKRQRGYRAMGYEVVSDSKL